MRIRDFGQQLVAQGHVVAFDDVPAIAFDRHDAGRVDADRVADFGRAVPVQEWFDSIQVGDTEHMDAIRDCFDLVEEAVAILKDKPCTNAVFGALRKMKTMRQIEAAELLVNANNYSVAYVNAILAGTPQAQLAESSRSKKIKGITPEAMARMEQELARLQEGIASIQDTYGQDNLHLTVTKGYIGKLLGNAGVVRYLAQNHSEFLGEFQTITEVVPSETADAE